ncbi:hypothetical protein [Nocardioides baculatus]|jgi:hypothetical protein|uniref:Uncharacterized protein n=1 Tax=Nocardioides baculatus TaxID=2801337 RepID=A0ABS1LD60_9ACTN|nr:hypothetical protein [Nocardioides baculatus]MBL0748461.1 hypothetical protein [Nocardioides baculatus]
MSWLGILLIGFAVTDLVHSARKVKLLPQMIGALSVLVLGMLADMTSGRDVVALLVIAVVVLAWGFAVTWGFGHPAQTAAWVPLALFGVALTAGVACSGLAPAADGPLDRWLGSMSLPAVDGLSADRFLLLLGAFGLQLSTGNVLVRLVLKSTGTINPGKDGAMPETKLKGGRLLGPLERVFILALAMGGQVTAASIVVAAKGLLRFPELSSRQEQATVHEMTEYFLLGSFMSWLVALGSYVLLV